MATGALIDSSNGYKFYEITNYNFSCVFTTPCGPRSTGGYSTDRKVLTVKQVSILVFHLYPFVSALHSQNNEKGLKILALVWKPAPYQERHFPYEDVWFRSKNKLVLATFVDRDFFRQLPGEAGIVLGRALNFVMLWTCLPVIEFDLAFISRSESILQIWRIIRLFCLRADNFNKQCLL